MQMPTLAQNAESKKKGVKCEKSDAEYSAIHFAFFTFRGTYVAGLTKLLCDLACLLFSLKSYIYST